MVNNFDKINSKGTITIDSRIQNEKKGVFQASSQVFFDDKKVANGNFRYINPKFFLTR